MKLVKIVLLMVVVVMVANAGKVTWGANGKPVVATTSKKIKGCQQGGFNSYLQDKNTTTSCG